MRERAVKRLVSVLSSAAVAATLIWLLAPQPAHAYLDPGSGSYLLQLALAALLGILLSLRLFWGRIKAFLRRVAGKEKDEEGPDGDG
jgi:hypothetical protein